MRKTVEMFEATHKRNESFDWNGWYEDQDESLHNIGNWIDHDSVGASHALGEDVIYAVSEALEND